LTDATRVVVDHQRNGEVRRDVFVEPEHVVVGQWLIRHRRERAPMPTMTGTPSACSTAIRAARALDER
jgi:hypothetical protein